MLVVLVIIGLLAGVVGPRLFSNVDKSKVTTARAQISALSKAVDQLRLDIDGRCLTPEWKCLIGVDVRCSRNLLNQRQQSIVRQVTLTPIRTEKFKLLVGIKLGKHSQHLGL